MPLPNLPCVKTAAHHGGVEQDPQIEQFLGGRGHRHRHTGRMFDLISQGHLQSHRLESLVAGRY